MKRRAQGDTLVAGTPVDAEDLSGDLEIAIEAVGGALGGLDGPANAIYARLAEALRPFDAAQGRQAQGDPSKVTVKSQVLSSLRLHYRQPGEFTECVLDVLAGLSLLKGLGAGQVALVGHSRRW